MRTRTTAAAFTGAALLFALVACNPQDQPVPESKASSPSSQQPAGLTAKTAVAGLADATGVTTLGDPQDNTDSCSNKAAGKDPHANDCAQLITTDTVSVYEFEKSAVAATWVKGMSKASPTRTGGRSTGSSWPSVRGTRRSRPTSGGRSWRKPSATWSRRTSSRPRPARLRPCAAGPPHARG